MNENDLPRGQSLSPAELQEQFVLVEDIPFGNSQLAYRILIRRDWGFDRIIAESVDLGTTHLKPLAIFAGAPHNGVSPYLQIQALTLVREISAAHWLRHFAEITNRQIIVFAERSDQFADSVMSFQVEERVFRGRATALIDGNRLFLLFAFASEEEYTTLAEAFGVSVASFKLRNPSPQRSIELRQQFQIENVLHGQYPRSWRSRTPENTPPGKAVLDLYNFDDDGVLNGMMRIKVAEKSLADMSIAITQVQQEFIEGNLRLRDRIHSGPLTFPEGRFKNGRIEIFGATLDNPEALSQELWISVGEADQRWVSVTLLTPNRQERFYAWAINKKAYEIILQSLMPER